MASKEDRATTSAASTTAHPVLAGQDAIRPWQEDVYRSIHQHPELSNQ